MYLPQQFEETRDEELYRLIANRPLGIIVISGSNGLNANHIPFQLNLNKGEKGHLLAHIARANPLWREITDDDEVLVIFSGANAYISPNWYPSKQAFHRQVPTWNYQAVHVYGKIKVRDDEKFIRGVVAHLTREHEKRAEAEKIWKMTDAPKEYIAQMLTAIVGIEIEVTKMVGKWKLSQNREEGDLINAANELRKRGEWEVSTEMLNTIAR
jgi:transcriptional regulator